MKKNYSRSRIPHRFGAIREECLDAESLEFVLLTAQQNLALYHRFEEHFLTCKKCLRRIRAIATFYKILENELQDPASPKVVTFARELAETVE